MEDFFLVFFRAVVVLCKEGPFVFCKKAWRFVWIKTPLAKIYVKEERIELSAVLDSSRTLLYPRVSVIIPVKNGGNFFLSVLDAIQAQKGLRELELIIIDSGSVDGTAQRARQYTPFVYHIAPDDFDHARTRNLGARLATGDYLVYTTSDALFTSDTLLHSLVSVLESDERIGAVTCRQQPQTDADLMARFHIWSHDTFLGQKYDKVMWLRSKRAIPLLKRKIAALSNNCSAFRRSVILRYPFRTPIAEDLDVGMRLSEDGFRIAHLTSFSVMHSHNAPASYFLKLSYFGAYTIGRIVREWRTEWPALDAHCFFSAARSVYQKMISDSAKQRSLDALIESFAALGTCSHPQSIQKFSKIIIRAYRHSLSAFTIFLKTQPPASYVQKEVAETSEKIFATTIGTLLGEFSLCLQGSARSDTLQKVHAQLISLYE